MLRELIKKALDREGITPRAASLHCGMNVGWVGAILRGETRDPGIAAMVMLADLLKIDRQTLLDTVVRDLGLGADHQAKNEAVRALSQLSPRERQALVDSLNKPRN